MTERKGSGRWPGGARPSREAALKTWPADGRDVEISRLKAKVGELTMANELLDAKIDRLETHRPLARRRSRLAFLGIAPSPALCASPRAPLRRAVHPHPQREPALAPPLRHH